MRRYKGSPLEDFSSLEQIKTKLSPSNLTLHTKNSSNYEKSTKTMLEWGRDDLYSAKRRPFKMKPKQPQPHNRRKTRGHELQSHHSCGVHHGPTVVSYGSSFSFLLLSYNHDILGAPMVSQMKVKCWVKMVQNLHRLLVNNTHV